ncbi:MAG: class I SAM-dependent methyltransferase [Crocinitomicaceae bacterium]
MKTLDEIKGLDIYLLDQFLKDKIAKNSKILDAGCGSGRNIYWLLLNSYDVSAFDINPDPIIPLKSRFPELKFQTGRLEDQPFNDQKFDFIICNAVLHFANDHTHFHQMFEALCNSLAHHGILFIRMTSNIGLENKIELEENGRCQLPDLSERYVITRKQIDDLCSYHGLQLIEPVKTVKVEELRSMTTIVLQKAD